MDITAKSEDYQLGYNDGEQFTKHDHKFIEEVIDTYLVVKNDIKDIDYMERHDIISMIIDKLNK